ncbi:unnamed protein product [Arabis nemorensis]|uniref:Uncharacterized protein n=1 Tax=Arabis nemorensis TaxID=586526 RepID=A0A565BJE2_9BRAS|nr:unnamed protein product [Arabis nemorensis]
MKERRIYKGNLTEKSVYICFRVAMKSYTRAFTQRNVLLECYIGEDQKRADADIDEAPNSTKGHQTEHEVFGVFFMDSNTVLYYSYCKLKTTIERVTLV